jgi:uncharacterized SAM-binding protein YcdF (DUF218 family)
VWLLLFMGLVIAWRKREKRIFISVGLSWLLLTFGGNPYCARLALASLEEEFIKLPREPDTALSTIVVLGGGSNADHHGRAQMDTAGDRFALAAELFHAGKAERIICTGGHIEGMDLNSGLAVGDLGAELLTRLGVPSDVVQTVGGRTTQEEMQQVSALLGEEPEVGLITSAFHMQRALRLAKKHGLKFRPLPADFASRQSLRLQPIDIVPTGFALDMSARAVKERLAQIVGR